MATQRQKLMANKTRSNVPQSPKQKKMWIRARQIAVKQSGARTEKEVPWQLVQTIYQNAVKANKVPKLADVKKAKYSVTVANYAKKPKKPSASKRKRK